MKHTFPLLTLWLAFTLAAPAANAQGQENQIRKNLTERLPSLPRIEEVRRTPMSGLFEIRTESNEIFYTDAEGNFLIPGTLIDTRQKRTLTEERMEKLLAVPFDQLPLRNAFTQVRGNGKRKLSPPK